MVGKNGFSWSRSRRPRPAMRECSSPLFFPVGTVGNVGIGRNINRLCVPTGFPQRKPRGNREPLPSPGTPSRFPQGVDRGNRVGTDNLLNYKPIPTFPTVPTAENNSRMQTGTAAVDVGPHKSSLLRWLEEGSRAIREKLTAEPEPRPDLEEPAAGDPDGMVLEPEAEPVELPTAARDALARAFDVLARDPRHLARAARLLEAAGIAIPNPTLELVAGPFRRGDLKLGMLLLEDAARRAIRRELLAMIEETRR